MIMALHSGGGVISMSSQAGLLYCARLRVFRYAYRLHLLLGFSLCVRILCNYC
jgi:hypothetical protein